MGLAWRAEVLPGLGTTWRVPAWVVGEREVRRIRRGDSGMDESGRRYEDLRRRLEGEVAAASGSSGDREGGGGEAQRRRNVGGFVERLRGAF